MEWSTVIVRGHKELILKTETHFLSFGAYYLFLIKQKQHLMALQYCVADNTRASFLNAFVQPCVE